MTDKIVVALALWLVSAFAVKQASYILMNGSVFEWLRIWIVRGAQGRSFLFGKLRDLFNCNLCMTTQVTLWAVAPAGTVMAYQHLNLETWQVPLAFMAIVFGVSGLAIGVWNFTEFRRKHFEAQAEYYEQKIALLQDRLYKGGVFKLISQNHFDEVLDRIEYACKGITCPYRYRDCYREEVPLYLRDMVSRGQIGADLDLALIELALLRVIPEYIRTMWYWSGTPKKKTEIRDSAYKNFLSSE